MKTKSRYFIVILVLCLAMSLTACNSLIEQFLDFNTLETNTLETNTPESNTHETNLPEILPAVNFSAQTIDKSQSLYGPLALVNGTHEYKFPAEANNNLANIWEYRVAHTQEGAAAAYKTSTNSLLLNREALSAMHEWLTAFYKATGKNDVLISASYRTFEEQDAFAIPAGKSNHHTGFGVTLKIYDGTVSSNICENPEYYTWLAENAHKYGYVVRYPDNKEAITGVSDYTEHFHYVGVAPAVYMKQNNLCLEEFVAQIKAYTYNAPLEVTDSNGQDWLIYYTACPGDMATVMLPTNFTYTVSGDNEGGIIVCVSLSQSAAAQ